MCVVLLLPVGALLALGAIEAVARESRVELPCWVLPNLRGMAFPTNSDCPIGALGSIGHAMTEDGVRSIGSLEGVFELAEAAAGASLRTAGVSAAHGSWVDLPLRHLSRATLVLRLVAALLGTMLLLGTPILLLLRSSVASAVPLGILYSSLSLVWISAAVGQHSEVMTRVALAALPIAPAAVMHLSFSFPRERSVAREAPLVLAGPYGLALLLAAAGTLAIDVAPSIWPSYLAVLTGVAAGSWLALMTSCGYALRESESSLERASARLVFFGSLMVPLGPWIVFLPAAKTPGEAGVFYLWCAAATMPLPIALAITRYNLFELGWKARGIFSRVVFMATGAALIAAIFGTSLLLFEDDVVDLEVAPLFLAGAACILTLEPLRSRIPTLFEEFVTPRLRRLRHARQRLHDQLQNTRDEDSMGHVLGAILATTLRPSMGCVVLGDSAMNRIVLRFGGAAGSDPSLVRAAFHALGDEEVLHLQAKPETAERFPALLVARVEAILAIGDGAGRYGLALLGPSTLRAPFMGVELEFAADLCVITASYIRGALATRGLLAAERQAATGRLAVWLAHDVLKDLGWMRRLLRRLPKPNRDITRFERDVAMLLDLSDEVVEAVERVLAEANGERSAEQPPFDDVIGTAVRRVESVHGAKRITESIDSRLRARPCSPHLSRAVSNLLDNALHASPHGETVHLQATTDGELVRITIDDRGPGVAAGRIAQVFEPGVSERLGSGGSGLGLPLAREIAESLGGRVWLEPGRNCGTRAVIEVPARLGVRE